MKFYPRPLDGRLWQQKLLHVRPYWAIKSSHLTSMPDKHSQVHIAHHLIDFPTNKRQAQPSCPTQTIADCGAADIKVRITHIAKRNVESL